MRYIFLREIAACSLSPPTCIPGVLNIMLHFELSLLRFLLTHNCLMIHLGHAQISLNANLLLIESIKIIPSLIIGVTVVRN